MHFDIVQCKPYFDISNCLGVDDGVTDRRSERRTCDGNSDTLRRTLKLYLHGRLCHVKQEAK